MNNNKGFIISTTLYSAFGVMMITVASILFVLSSKQATMSSMTDKLKLCIEECNTPASICEGVCDDNDDDEEPPTYLSSLIIGYNKPESQEKRGLYKSTDTNSGNPTYYFAGESDTMNNYVSFGTWSDDITNSVLSPAYGTEPADNYFSLQVAKAGDPIIWRVVRINEDSSIRLITENNIFISDGFRTSDYNESSIKSTIETWYDDNIGKWSSNDRLDSKVVIGKYCNDKTNVDTNTKYYDAYERINNENPTFKCPDTEIIESKIGLLSADEALYAKKSIESGVSYLRNYTNFWTMTPYSSYLGGIYVFPATGGYLTPGVNYQGVRVVINLKSDVKVSRGTGLSKLTAYEIEL